MPVYTQLTKHYAGLGVGRRVRERRKRKGWTLRDLSERLGVSVASLSAMEREKATLDLDQLIEVARHLGISPAELLPRGSISPFEVTRGVVQSPGAEEAVDVVDAHGGRVRLPHAARPLAPRFVGRRIDPVHLQIAPVPPAGLPFVQHDQDEFFYVVRGSVECLIDTPEGLLTEQVHAGDCVYLRSDLRHALRSPLLQPAETIHVLCPPRGSTDFEVVDRSRVFGGDAAPPSAASGVAHRIRGLRQAHRLSIAEFAASLAMGVKQAGEMERGDKAIPLDVLLRICNRYHRPIEYFVACLSPSRPYCSVQRASDVAGLPRRRRVGSGVTFRALAGDADSTDVFAYHATLSPAPAAPVILDGHHGQEFVFVLRGQVGLYTVVDGSVVHETLGAGDACLIDSTVPHRFVGMPESQGSEQAPEAIVVFWCPLGERYLFSERSRGPVAFSPTRPGHQGSSG